MIIGWILNLFLLGSVCSNKKKKVFCAWTVNSEHKNVPPSFMQSDAWTVNYLRSSWFQNVCLKNVFGVLRNVFCNDSEYSWKIGCRHHLAIQIPLPTECKFSLQASYYTCWLKLKHVSMTPCTVQLSLSSILSFLYIHGSFSSSVRSFVRILL